VKRRGACRSADPGLDVAPEIHVVERAGARGGGDEQDRNSAFRDRSHASLPRQVTARLLRLQRLSGEDAA